MNKENIIDYVVQTPHNPNKKVLDDMLETLIEENGKGKLGGADWNQNDENASDYIKNRPFYEENTRQSILEETTVTFGVMSEVRFTLTKSFEIGQKYIVNMNGTQYICTCWDDYGVPYLGHGETGSMELGDRGEDVPFLFYPANSPADTSWYAQVAEPGTHTISIVGNITEIHHIDSKYLPSEVVDDSYCITVDLSNGTITCNHERIFDLLPHELMTKACVYFMNQSNGTPDVYTRIQQIFCHDDYLVIGTNITDILLYPFDKTFELD